MPAAAADGIACKQYGNWFLPVNKKLTAHSRLAGRSPTPVLTGPCVAQLRRSEEIQCIRRGMAVSIGFISSNTKYGVPFRCPHRPAARRRACAVLYKKLPAAGIAGAIGAAGAAGTATAAGTLGAAGTVSPTSAAGTASATDAANAAGAASAGSAAGAAGAAGVAGDRQLAGACVQCYTKS